MEKYATGIVNNPMFNYLQFCDDLRQWRDNLSWGEMSGIVGLSVSTLQRIFSQDHISQRTFDKLCDACELNPDDYFQKPITPKE